MSFENVVAQMPVLMKKLEASPFRARGEAKDLPQKGVYVFYEDGKPIYVGRSRNLRQRILNHSRPSSTHNSASFAFLLAREKTGCLRHTDSRFRAQLEKDPNFEKIFKEQKARISRMKIKAVEIEDPNTQAIFEIYCSEKLRTSYNDFDTH